ncbi:MAG: type II secretion system F family protein [Candidatus Aenigmatarchaeota archaeon]
MLKELSIKVFGNLIAPYLDSFEPLEVKVRSAQIKYTLKEYLSIALTLTLITFLSAMLAGSFFVTVFTERAGFSYTFSIILAFLASGGVFIGFYWYPNLRSKNIETSIERDLPFAVASMAAAASSGTHPVEIFKMLSLREGVLGDDAKRIYRDVKMFGTDISSALAKVANRTPSLAWSELLWGLVSTMTTGGDVYKYLTDKTKDSMQQYRRVLESYSSKINFYTEIYITLIIVGTLFFIVLSSVMSPLVGGDIILVQTFIVFFFVPATSAGFIVLLKGLSPL